MFENGVEEGVGTKREEVIRGLHMRSAVFYTFHQTLLDDKVKYMRFMRHVKNMGEKRNAYNVLASKPEGKRQLA